MREASSRGENHVGQSEILCLSPGGSIVYKEDAMKAIKKAGRVIWIKPPIEVIAERLGREPKAILGLKEKTLEEIYEERVPLYEKYADIVLVPKNTNSDDTTDEAEEALGQI